MLLESDPHSVLEGMLIGAYAIGASHCLIYVRADSLAAERLRTALEQMRAWNLLGAGILDSHFNAEIEIKEVPAFLVAGHLTELLHCMEERRSLPHIIPAGPGIDEFAEKPAIVVSPEVLSCFSGALLGGTKENKATKVVTLAGCVTHKHTVEVALGTTIEEIVEKFGGGSSGGKTIKAVQLGGPAGVFVGSNSLDIPIDCDAAEESRSNIDSGTIEVFDSDSCMVDTTKDAMSYLQSQSCGKCLFCREGCLQMLTILEDISDNRGKPQDLDLLAELGEEMRTACLCIFGRTAPNPVLSSIRLFREEYDERIKGFP
jgi:NADH-quinone oxidoreductase subunit F